MIWMGLMLLIVAGVGWTASRKLEADEPRFVMGLGVKGLAAMGAFLVLFSMITTVPAGHVGIPVVFGAVEHRHIPEGMHLVNPLADVVKLSVRTETYTMVSSDREGQVRGDDSIYALSADGVVMAMDVSVAYKLVDASAPWMYRHIGRTFVDSIVRPAARSAVPEATAKHTFQDAYSTGREQLATLVKQKMKDRIGAILRQYGDIKGDGIVIQEVFLRKIELPPNLKLSIEQKMQAEQEAQRMQFILDREKREAERKRIEAQGIRDFQHTVAEGISDKLLQWKGIEATEKLSHSANAKLVIVGSGKGGLPVILNPGQ